MSRGPLSQPDSRRSVAENGGAAPEAIQDVMNPPSWLTKAEKEYFVEVIDMQRAAGVGMRAIDAELYARYVRFTFMFRKSKDSGEMGQFARRINEIAAVLGIGEYSRQRMGIRGKKADTKGKLARLIEMKQKNGTVG
jgi:hypothetical protein